VNELNGLAERMKSAGASEAEIDFYMELVAQVGVKPEAAMLRLIADICQNTRMNVEASGSEVMREMRRVHALIRRLAEVMACARRMSRV
jgi:hypothetical protein